MIEDEDLSDDEENTTFETKNHLQKVIVDAFLLFVAYGKGNKIPRENLGKVIRHLGCVPTEKELNEFAENVVNQKNPKTVTLDEFVPYMEKQIKELRYKPGTADELLQAFRILDTESKGSLSKNFVKNVLCEGESFDKNEIDEAIKTIYDPDYDVINYDVWTNKLLGKTKMNVYALIPEDDSPKRTESDDELNRLLAAG